MKQFNLKILYMTFFLFVGMNVVAQTYETINGIKYELAGTEAYVVSYEGSPTDVVIPETIESEGLSFNVTDIKSNAFRDCSSITSIRSEGEILKTIGKKAFYQCTSLKSASFPGVKIIYSSAFTNCFSLESVSFPNVEIIHNDAFFQCIELKSISFPIVNSIKEFAFVLCRSLTSISLPNVETIYGGAFQYCRNLKKVYLGTVLNYIDDNYGGAFEACSSLPYIVIPAGCNVRDSVFYQCSRLQAIIYLGTQTSQCGSNATVYNVDNMVTWSQTLFTYTGHAPAVTFTNNIPEGFEPTNNLEMPELESDAGSHVTYVPFIFANSDMSFSVDIPYRYTINKIELNARVKDSSKIYGDENPQFKTEYSGFVNGEDESVILSNGLYTTEATIGSDVGTYTISQSDAEAKNYSFNYEDGVLNVNKAQLTMTANDKSMVYGGQVPTLDASYTGLKNNESKPVWTTNPNITTTATSTSQVGAYPITISDGVAKNYDVSFVDGTLSIEKAELTLRVENKERLYGDANPEFTLSYSGLKNEESVPEWVSLPEMETIANVQSSVGSYPITIRNAIATNYNVTTEEGVLTINKAPLTLHPINVTRKYGEPNPQFELEFEGLKNNESSPEWTVSPVITTSATETSDVGNYNIEITSADAKNYILNKGVGVLTVTKAPLEVAVKDCTKKYGENNPTFTLQYSGLLNDETEPVWTELPTFTTEATKTSGVGVYAVNASGGIMKNYETSAIAPGTLTITQSSLTIKPRNASRLYFEENPSFSCTYEGFIGNDDESVFTTEPVFTTNATKESPVGVYLIEANGAEAENYEISYEKGELSIIKRQLTVSTNNYTRTYKEDNPEFELIYNGFVNNENEENLLLKPVASTEATENSDTGVYDINISGGFAENYDFNYMGGKLTIEKAYQTLTWEQDLSEVEQYEQIELNATATSGLDISYTIEGAQICSINKIGNKTYLDCYGVGESVISAIQEGNNNYWQTTKAYKPLKIHTTNGISHIMMEIGENSEIYDIKGNRLQTTQRGLNIIKMEDGTIRKVVIK